jgi:hypothetical protein
MGVSLVRHQRWNYEARKAIANDTHQSTHAVSVLCPCPGSGRVWEFELKHVHENEVLTEV